MTDSGNSAYRRTRSDFLIFKIKQQSREVLVCTALFADPTCANRKEISAVKSVFAGSIKGIFIEQILSLRIVQSNVADTPTEFNKIMSGQFKREYRRK